MDDLLSECLKTSIPEEKSKKLKYVKVYDILYERIEQGEFPPGSQLPSEPELSKQMGVSRMTLRQALALLREDGLIHNVQGKGNFVLDHNKEIPGDLSNIGNPVFQSSAHSDIRTEMEFRLEPPTDSISDTLKQKTPVVVITDRWYRSSDTPFAYSLSFLPIETISNYDINLKDTDNLTTFLNYDIYEKAASSQLNFRASDAGNFTAQKYRLSEKGYFLLILETLYNEAGVPIIVSKHYMPLENCNINIVIKN